MIMLSVFFMRILEELKEVAYPQTKNSSLLMGAGVLLGQNYPQLSRLFLIIITDHVWMYVLRRVGCAAQSGSSGAHQHSFLF